MKRIAIALGLAALLAGAAQAQISNPGIPSSPVLSGTVTGTYTLGGTPTIGRVGPFGDTTTVAIGSGADAAQGTNSLENVLVGQSAGAAVTSANRNVFVGASAGATMTTNAANQESVGVGYQAGASITTGIENTLLGYKAGAALTTGGENTLIGWNAGVALIGVTGDVAIGNAALMTSTTTPSTVAVGSDALKFYTTNQGVTALGANAGKNMVAGGNSTLIGTNAGATWNFTAGTANSNIAIGDTTFQGVAGALNTIRNNIAIGNSAILAAGGLSGLANNTAIGHNAGMALTSGASNTILGYQVGSATLATGSNNVLIGTTSDIDAAAASTSNTIKIGAGSTAIYSATGAGTPSTAASSITGTLALPNITTGTNADVVCVDSGFILRIQAAASCTISSMRFKRDIFPVAPSDSLSTIMALQPKSFFMKDGHANRDKNAARQQIGLIAEDVAAVEPRLALYEPDMQTPKSWRLEGMIAELVGAVQQQQKQIEALRRELKHARRR